MSIVPKGRLTPVNWPVLWGLVPGHLAEPHLFSLLPACTHPGPGPAGPLPTQGSEGALQVPQRVDTSQDQGEAK